MSKIREIRLPALSATMEEATLLAWKVAPGDEVREGQPIAEVSTDKVDMDLESPVAGIMHELLVDPGSVVPLGEVLATVATEAEDLLGGLDLGGGPAVSAPSPASGLPSPVSSGPVSTTHIVPASPPARKMARELGIDLAAVEATGTRGQVTPVDVVRYAEARSPATTAVTPTFESPGSRVGWSPHDSSSRSAELTPGLGLSSDVDAAKRLAVRRATADVMGGSATIPQFTLWKTLELDRAAARRGGQSWTTVLTRGLADALRRHPELNARWDEESRNVEPFDEIRVGLAVDRPGIGLVVVTLTLPDDPEEADRLIRAAADRVRIGKLRPEDMVQASITLSNLGGLGVDRFNALLFPPQAAILSAGSIRMRPVATGERALKAVLTCEVGLTVDHRVADGADGARFLETFAALVQSG